MFKQLRNRFLILNLVIISVMMIISFTTIYVLTYSNVRNDINREMSKISDFNKKSNNGGPNNNNGPRDLKQPDNKDNQFPLQRSVSFNLIIDNNKNLTNYFSAFSMEESFYENAKEKALAEGSNKGNFKLDDSYWEYNIRPLQDGSGFELSFLDVTSNYNYLKNLVYTFIAVASIMLIAIFFISKFFANKAINPIKESFEKQKQFIADASHELKTPLAVINTNTDVLLSNSEDTINNQSKWIHYIKSEIERMTKLTNDLLYLAQVDNSDIKLIFTDFDLSEAIENIMLTMEASVFENNKFLDYNIEPNIISHGNSEQIKQVIMILLDNATKYTNPNGKINISLNRHNNKAILTVSNTGKGIPKESLDKIFNRFYRVDKSRSKDSGGHGLGLSIAKAIVQQHHGKISVSSIENEITTFTVEIPILENK